MSLQLRLFTALFGTATLLCIQFGVWAMPGALPIVIWSGATAFSYVIAFFGDLWWEQRAARHRMQLRNQMNVRAVGDFSNFRRGLEDVGSAARALPHGGRR